ncbi:hypothetical protein AB0N06_33410 [Streptomyces sp. NPDC051020]|uniref:hypothetical protein n=1 Tax=Streptomyces sp. NPDC051020 TaxID=3155409 RepID=UPI00341AD0C4
MESIAFPHELVQAQRGWNSTYHALAAPHPRTLLRRRLLHLSARIDWRPFWTSDPGRSTEARMPRRSRRSLPRLRARR